MGQLRTELRELLEYLRDAEARAERSGNELLRRDPMGNRYAAEAGSLLATCNKAVRRLESLLSRLDREKTNRPAATSTGGAGRSVKT